MRTDRRSRQSWEGGQLAVAWGLSRRGLLGQSRGALWGLPVP